MLSEEEKKAIKLLERIKRGIMIDTKAPNVKIRNIAIEKVQVIDTISNIITKLKKENEELKQENRRIKFFSNNLYIEDYIPKRVIKNKIKEKQDKINKLHSASDCVIIDDLENEINVLKELLGDE